MNSGQIQVLKNASYLAINLCLQLHVHSKNCMNEYGFPSPSTKAAFVICFRQLLLKVICNSTVTQRNTLFQVFTKIFCHL